MYMQRLLLCICSHGCHIVLVGFITTSVRGFIGVVNGIFFFQLHFLTALGQHVRKLLLFLC